MVSTRKIYIRKNKTLKKPRINPNNIPIIIICWNNLTFIKNFVNQIKEYINPIILLDNNSSYPPLLEYYKDIKSELKDKITIKRLNKNYGHTVYLKLKKELPDIYILSDPDLELNKKMPANFAEIFLQISNKYKIYKVGSAINIKDKDKFINYVNKNGLTNYEWEKQFWRMPIKDTKYELYKADIDTTLCLVNNNYKRGNTWYFDNEAIRVAGDFTVKHLPWYKNFLKNTIPKDEIDYYKANNKSSLTIKFLLKK